MKGLNLTLVDAVILLVTLLCNILLINLNNISVSVDVHTSCQKRQGNAYTHVMVKQRLSTLDMDQPVHVQVL